MPVAEPAVLLGEAAKLWEDDDDFEEFVAGTYERRRESRERERDATESGTARA